MLAAIGPGGRRVAAGRRLAIGAEDAEVDLIQAVAELVGGVGSIAGGVKQTLLGMS